MKLTVGCNPMPLNTRGTCNCPSTCWWYMRCSQTCKPYTQYPAYTDMDIDIFQYPSWPARSTVWKSGLRTGRRQLGNHTFICRSPGWCLFRIHKKLRAFIDPWTWQCVRGHTRHLPNEDYMTWPADIWARSGPRTISYCHAYLMLRTSMLDKKAPGVAPVLCIIMSTNDAG